MRPLHAAVLFLSASTTSGPEPLKILRTAPADEATPTSVVTVTFDRPVAGSLDRTVDPKAIFTIAPAVKGRLEWRDPVTIRFTPAAPLASSVEYTVTVASTFAAMDGSRLEAPYRFTFRVRGPRLLTGSPVSGTRHPKFVTPTTRFELVYSTPTDLERLAATTHLEFNGSCAGRGSIRLKPLDQRPITSKDSWDYKEAGGYQRDRSADSLRRVVSLTPDAPLPGACTGELVAQSILDREGTSAYVRWDFQTYGPLRLLNAGCPSRPGAPPPLPHRTDRAGVQYARARRERAAARQHQARAVVCSQGYLGGVCDVGPRGSPQTAHGIHGRGGHDHYRYLRAALHRQRRGHFHDDRLRPRR